MYSRGICGAPKTQSICGPRIYKPASRPDLIGCVPTTVLNAPIRVLTIDSVLHMSARDVDDLGNKDVQEFVREKVAL